jgi:hypothetical protein
VENFQTYGLYEYSHDTKTKQAPAYRWKKGSPGSIAKIKGRIVS